MTCLLPISRDYTNLFKMPFNVSNEAFSDSAVSNMKKWTEFKLSDTKTVKTIFCIATTAITCTAISCLPKMVAFGSIAFSSLIYHAFATRIENKSIDLLNTMKNKKIIEQFSDSSLNKEALKDLIAAYQALSGDSITLEKDSIRKMKQYLESLEEGFGLNGILSKKHEKIITDQKILSTKLSDLETKLSLEEGSFSKELEKATLKDLSNDFTAHIRDLEDILSDLKEGMPLRDFLVENYTNLLTISEYINEEISALQENRSFFEENGALLNKIANIFLKIDLNIIHKMTACRNFIFYSVTATILLKLGYLFKVTSAAKWAMIINQSQPYLINGLGILAIAYAAKNVLNLIAHRNDEAKKQKELATITNDEKKVLIDIKNEVNWYRNRSLSNN